MAGRGEKVEREMSPLRPFMQRSIFRAAGLLTSVNARHSNVNIGPLLRGGIVVDLICENE